MRVQQGLLALGVALLQLPRPPLLPTHQLTGPPVGPGPQAPGQHTEGEGVAPLVAGALLLPTNRPPPPRCNGSVVASTAMPMAPVTVTAEST